MRRHRFAPAHRGLTVLETLLAAALLAMTAVALAPVVRQVLAESNPPPAPFSHAEFTRFVDLSLVQIAVNQLEGGSELQWESDVGSRTVHVTWSPSEDLDRGWLVFSCEGAVVLRWRQVPSAEPQEEPAE